MLITREQFEEACRKAFQETQEQTMGGSLWLRDVVSASLAALGIEIDDSCQCSTMVREYCASNECRGGSRIGGDEMVWVERTWVDVRQGDVIRPAGHDETHAAIVVKLGPVNHWHASPNASQYRPNESPMEWSAIPVTLRPLQSEFAIIAGMAERKPDFTPEHGMRPDAAVEIRVSVIDLHAIELCGGWSERVGVRETKLEG